MTGEKIVRYVIADGDGAILFDEDGVPYEYDTYDDAVEALRSVDAPEYYSVCKETLEFLLDGAVLPSECDDEED